MTEPARSLRDTEEDRNRYTGTARAPAPSGQRKVIPGYATDIVTDHSLRWLQQRDRSRPFLLMCHHKAPHRPWDPHPRHAGRYADEEIPYPETFDDDYAHRARAAAAAEMRIERDFPPRRRESRTARCRPSAAPPRHRGRSAHPHRRRAGAVLPPRPSASAGSTSATSRTTCAA